VPPAGNNVSIPNVANQPVVTSADVMLNNMVLNGENVTIGANRTISVSGTAVLGANIVDGAGLLSLGTAATITRTTGQVNCTLQKNFAGPGPMFEMPVGTTGAYSPLQVTVTSGSGQLTARANTGVPVPTPSGVDPTRTLQRFWTLSGAGIRSNITFNYLDGDVPGPPNNENIWAILRITGTTAVAYPDSLPYVVMDPTNNRFTIDDLESYSDWTAGEVLAPTAANANVSGRVIGPDGRGVSGALLAMQDQSGNTVWAVTNPFGYYRFAGIPAAQTYVISARHKRYEFQPRALTVNEDLTGVDFIAEP
jgi:hypothetical protein